ncbi:DUF4179 domain-containing protein [Desulfosporosinus youngiae]|uniref:DUF4179 domain-containing protein n=1 Tax=Desulfosporosinus youngiae DSM 17734 TaxID=768710 RepID=H5XSP6_9FIRM|nr:DUF4179 domain-containing protein [Desulfosporosinus youngiae]EHQ87714.1 hypothetical protein DesyoDRAFT_0525 [Desulfosporosinus youngiae DSM 17734]
MNDIEDILRVKKTRIDQIEVPEELEGRLRNALNKKKHVTRGRRFRVYGAAAAIVAMLLSFNYEVIAYYSKQLLGYDQVMNGSLRQLSELGKGQPVGQSFTFDNGVTVTVDYVMLDDNQLLLFYSIKDPSGHVDENKISPFMYLTAFWGEYHHQNSQGIINEEKTEIKYLSSFEPPKPFEKSLTLNFSQTDQGREVPAEINFTLNRTTAMGHTLKKSLNAKIEVGKAQIKIESILASPTKTVIEGSIQSLFELVKDQLSGERIRPKDFTLKLIANGKEVPVQGSGMSTDLNGITFHSDYDPLPPDLKQLQLELVRFGADHDVNQRYRLNKADDDKKQGLDILGQIVEINKIETFQGETHITISSAETLILSQVYLIIDGKKVSLEETIENNYDKLQDGSIIHTRTLRFLGTGNDLVMDVQRMAYSEDYYEVLEIPIF